MMSRKVSAFKVDIDRFGRLADEDKEAVLDEQLQGEIMCLLDTLRIDDRFDAIEPMHVLDLLERCFRTLQAIDSEMRRMLERSNKVERFRSSVDSDHRELETAGKLYADVAESAEADDGEGLTRAQSARLDRTPDAAPRQQNLQRANERTLLRHRCEAPLD